jgi:hypothetical protein
MVTATQRHAPAASADGGSFSIDDNDIDLQQRGRP